jgi:hypothetical protein
MVSDSTPGLYFKLVFVDVVIEFFGVVASGLFVAHDADLWYNVFVVSK